MKKFLVFIVYIISIIGYGQDSEERVINNGDFPVALYSGIPDIKFLYSQFIRLIVLLAMIWS